MFTWRLMLCHSASNFAFSSLKYLYDAIRAIVHLTHVESRTDLISEAPSLPVSSKLVAPPRSLILRGGLDTPPSLKETKSDSHVVMVDHRFGLRKNLNAKFIQSPSTAASDAHKHLLRFTTSRRSLDACLIDEDT
jgi:hypothetical protein